MKSTLLRTACLRTRHSPYAISHARGIHSAQGQRNQSAGPPLSSDGHPNERHKPLATAFKEPPLSILPLSSVLRTLLITTISSSPKLMHVSVNSLRRMLNSKSYLFDVDRNPVVRALLHQTFYKQFCVGESRIGVQDAMQQMRSCGYTDIILEYALEVLKGEEEDAEAAVERWRTGLLATVEMASPGSFVGLKWSGLGSAALQLLKEQKPPTPSMDSAMRQLCDAAAAKNVSLLPAAEESDTNPTYHSWSLNLQRIYNRSPSTQFDRPVIYNTYQAYLRSTPDLLSFHLADAKAHEYTLAVKLVRGAYLHSEPKHLVHSCKEDTDSAYDTLAANLLKQQYGGILRPLDGTLASFPKVAVVLATHNANSVHKAQKLRNVQLSQDPHANLPNLCYAQLQGMADEISCELVQASKTGLEAGAVGEEGAIDPPKVYKCTTWGSMRECLNYLLRRAAENKDAAGRTKATRQAMAAELMRRIKARIGLKAN